MKKLLIGAIALFSTSTAFAYTQKEKAEADLKSLVFVKGLAANECGFLNDNLYEKSFQQVADVNNWDVDEIKKQILGFELVTMKMIESMGCVESHFRWESFVANEVAYYYDPKDLYQVDFNK